MAEFTENNPDELGTGSMREKPHVLKLLQTWISVLKVARDISGDNVSPWKTPRLMLKEGMSIPSFYCSRELGITTHDIGYHLRGKHNVIKHVPFQGVSN